MKTGIATVSISGNLEEKIEAIAAAGFTGIEIFEQDFIADTRSPRAVGERIRDAGLEVMLFQPFRDFEGLPGPLRAKAFDRAERKFDVMQELGCDLVLVCSTVHPEALGGIDRAAADFGELGERAARRGLRVGYEALAWGRHVNDHRDAWEIVRRADHPAVGLILDSFHTLGRGIDPQSIRRIPGDRIFFVQLADAPAIEMDLLYWSRHFRNMPGEGDLAVTDFMRAVMATGYAGPISLEIFNDQFRGGSPRTIAQDGYRSLVALMDEVRRAEPEAAPDITPLPPPIEVRDTAFVEFAAQGEKLAELGFELGDNAFADAFKRFKDLADRKKHVFDEDIEALVEDETPFAVHYLNLDRFKTVNDTLGQATGDTVLREVAERLLGAAGGDNFVGRLGGDEFAVCQKTDSASVAHRFAEHLVRALAKPCAIDGNEITIGGSIGFARYPENGSETAVLLQAAAIALSRAKKNGRGCALGYHESMEREHVERHAVEKRLRQALAAGGFELHYQPLFRTGDQKLRGFEALLRLRDENGKPIPPSVFIPVAEEIGLICRIGDWALAEACRFAATWPDELTVAVNLSPVQFERGDLVMKARAALKESGLAANRLELEITESLLITNPQSVLAQLHQLRALGIRIALDDFGTGYSSLSYLWQFPFDKLKIDRAFMNGIDTRGSKSREILKTVVSLGRILDLAVTAEGVETKEQLAALEELKCDLTQGFLLGRPMPAEDLAAFVVKAMAPAAGKRRGARKLREAAS